MSVWGTGDGGRTFEVAKPCRCVLKVSTSLTLLLQALNNGILNMHTFKGDWPSGPGGLTRTNRRLTTNPLQRKTGGMDTQQSNASLHTEENLPRTTNRQHGCERLKCATATGCGAIRAVERYAALIRTEKGFESKLTSPQKQQPAPLGRLLWSLMISEHNHRPRSEVLEYQGGGIQLQGHV